MAESAVSFVIGRLGTFLEQEVGRLSNFRQDIIYIRYEFESMMALLKDADAMGATQQGNLVKVWLKEVRHLAFEIEDVLDEYMLRFYTQQTRVRGCGTRGWIKRTVYFFKNLTKRSDLSSQIGRIKVRVQDTSSRRERYNFDNLGQASTSSVNFTKKIGHDPRVDALFLGAAQLVGVNEPRDKLIEWLVDEADSRLSVLSVYGTGGLGKTTLAKRLHESERARQHFGYHAWVTVSQTYEINRILSDLIKQVLAEDQIMEWFPRIEGANTTKLKEMLHDHYKNKRYVIFLDDIWEFDAWRDVKCALPDSGCGSRIIVTTRSQDLAKACVENSGYAYELQPLNPDDAWRLFQTVAFKSVPETYRTQHLKEISQNFLKKCNGLPLAIVSIASLLSTKETIEWDQLYRDSGSLLQHHQLDDVNKILSLSYDDLPHHLKSCLLYFCIFPEYYSINRSKILRLWVAEGFVDLESKNSRSIVMTKEDVAKNYLNELVARSLIQGGNTRLSGKVTTYRIHDLLREFILTKAREEDFAAFFVEGSPNRECYGDKVRRLSILNNKDDGNENGLQESISYLSHLRSLFVFGGRFSFGSSDVSTFLSEALRLLRVLDLEGAPLKQFPGEVASSLFFLRYLSLRNTSINSLPNSLGKLVNLETLDIKETKVSKLPVSVLKLKDLRRLLSQNLTLPEGIGSLTTLETLRVNNETNCIGEELGKLTRLRSLSISHVDREDGRHVLASLGNMEYLRSLVLGSSEKVLQVQNLGRRPPPLLQRLTLHGLLEEAPQWILELETLTKLELVRSKLKHSSFFEGLQLLSNLVELRLDESFDGKELCFKKGGYCKLRSLKLTSLGNLGMIKVEEGAMPRIQHMELINCPELKKVPMGIEHLTTLILIETDTNMIDHLSSHCWKLGHTPKVALRKKELDEINREVRQKMRSREQEELLGKVRAHAQAIRAAILFTEVAKRVTGAS